MSESAAIPTSPPRRGHVRATSEDRRVTVPRRRTKGPLELGDPPFATGTTDSATNSGGMTSPPPQSPPAGATSATTFAPKKDLTFLLSPQNFHPIPSNVLPPPFLSSTPSSQSPHELLSALHFRGAAIAAANMLTQSSASDLSQDQIFALWYIRLLSLYLLAGSCLHTAALEVKVFGDLGTSFYRDEITGQHIVPWELRVLAVRLTAIGFGDWRRSVGLYYDLAREARAAVLDPKVPEGERKSWRRRLEELGVRVANALIELGDLEAAKRHLFGLGGGSSGAREDMLIMVFIRAGMVEKAKGYVGEGKEKLVEALAAMADGRWEKAASLWEECGGGDDIEKGNKAVCLLYIGKLEEARSILEGLVDDRKVCPSMVFNLATMYELCGEGAKWMKSRLAEKVAECGQEMGSAAFKM